jgi:hypothetical protein
MCARESRLPLTKSESLLVETDRGAPGVLARQRASGRAFNSPIEHRPEAEEPKMRERSAL